MIFASLVLLSALLIESIGTLVSVIGLASIFSANPIIIVLAVALDIGKLVSVTFLYKHWKNVNLLMKSYMTIACIVLMIITSAGAFGFLSGEFQKAISNTNQNAVIIATLTDEQGRLQKRKEEIDSQIAKLPDNSVKGRTKLMNQFAPEVNRINDRLVEIDKKIPELKIESIKKNVEVGPIMYIAEAFGTSPEQAVKWVIFIIIFVFDPLAIALLLASNFLIENRKKEKLVKEVPIQDASNEAVYEDEVLTAMNESEQIAEAKAIIPEVVHEIIPDVEIAPEVIPDTSLKQSNITYDWNPAVSPSYNFSDIVDKLNVKESVNEELLSNEEVAVLLGLPEVTDTIEEAKHDVEPAREVITVEQLTSEVKKPVRSSLEDISEKTGDIQTDEEDRSRSLKSLFLKYNSDSAQ